MKYTLKNSETKRPLKTAFKRFLPFVQDEKKQLVLAFSALVLNSLLALAAPAIIGHAIDTYIIQKNMTGVLQTAVVLLVMYGVALFTSYKQITITGGIGQRLLFRLRTAVFVKLQELPVAFFNQNKAGDLISRINNDTDTLNQFFSQALMQFVGNFFVMIGAAIFLLVIKPELGAAALVPAVLIVIFTQVTAVWVKRRNKATLQSVGGMSGQIQESLQNFKVVAAFYRRDYFQKKFAEVNAQNYEAAVSAGLVNNIFTPIYTFASHVAQIIVLFFGVYLIAEGQFTIGLLVGFLTYIARFYDPIRQLAGLWATFQLALSGWERISDILDLETDLPVIAEEREKAGSKKYEVLRFDTVAFRYEDGKEVLHKVNMILDLGKTYALVGPTGGGKTTTASLMARLFDPTEGKVYLAGKDIRTYTPLERAKAIGFILQEPFLFSGTVRENILYGNDEKLDLEPLLKKFKLNKILERFSEGLETKVTGGETMSLGQRQLIAFMRAVLRQPKLLILDEATANIDTVTEKLLDEILDLLPKETTKVIIAHRLNTIENADEIYFVNGGEIVLAGSLQHAINMLLKGKRKS